MGKFCSNCGAPTEPNARFCNQCGAQINTTVTPAPAQETPGVILTVPKFEMASDLDAPTPVAAPAPVVEPAPAPVAAPAPVVEPAPAPVATPIPVIDPGPVVIPPPVVAPTPAATPAKKKGKGLLIALIAVLLVVGLVVAGFVSGLFEGSDSETDSSTSAEKDDEEDSDDNEDQADADPGEQNPDDNTSNGQPTAPGNDQPTDDQINPPGGNGPSQPSNPNTVPTRTIMVYIVGSNLESESGCATEDIAEMVESNFDTTKNNLLLCTGGSYRWQNSIISAQEDAIYRVVGDDVSQVSAFGSQNIIDDKTLTKFLNYCTQNYPADEFSLILWNHGGGPIEGYGLDEFSRDSFSLSELTTALKNSSFNKNNKLELIGFDACLMGSIETAWSFKDYADYFVASQELEPGSGWNYRFLSELGNCKNGGELGTLIIDYYFDFYESIFDLYPRYEAEITLSCVDLSKIDAVENCVEDLFDDMDDELSQGKLAEVSRCRFQTKAFGKSDGVNSSDLVDLEHLASLLSDTHSAEATALINAINAYVVCSKSNVENANGVSIYHPYDLPDEATVSANIIAGLGFAPEYVEYIREFSRMLKTGTSDSYRSFSNTRGVAKTNGQASDLSITLTAEQMATFSSAKYYIFKELPAESTFSKEVEYLHIFSGYDAVLNADGTLSATYQGKAVFGKDSTTGEYSGIPLSMYQIYDGIGSEKYYFPCMFWHFGENLEMDLIPVNWLMKVKNGVPTLLGAYDMTADTDNKFPDKLLIDSADYEIYTFANNSYTYAIDQDGFVQLTFSGSSYGYEYNSENGFSLEFLPVDYEDGYYAMFVIEDIYGNTYTSSFIDLGA